MSEPSRASSSPAATRLVETVCSIIATEGLDAATVREVASAAGVSIGAVQHHFRTKDEMLVAAFRHVVETTEKRVAAVELGTEVRQNLSAILRELLPLDDIRFQEAKVYVAFAARATTSPALAVIQRSTLDHIGTQLAEAFRAAAKRSGARTTAAAARREAELLLAVTDGLTFDAVTRGVRPDAKRLGALLDTYLRRALGE
ncbi:MAG TPA: TetR/AcrR family transcriptional regulator [Flexivirga sp.]|uniref:TetR/AcrR family transcriptional regulator n=1 Tax=Flexivirga sp. TaxID=1962927 RepID=UPI002CBCDA28|nr:TetR/AcrR family transcriptional regulator [Flexivirga sp.]HWC23553.1 TetR/AcrR family transcriptional regulator [Flexivirga sp.]